MRCILQMCAAMMVVVFAIQAGVKRGVWEYSIWMWYVRSSFYCLFESMYACNP